MKQALGLLPRRADQGPEVQSRSSRTDDPPAIHLNADILGKYREEMKKYYYDPSKFPTYLEQLGIKYPMVRPTPQQ